MPGPEPTTAHTTLLYLTDLKTPLDWPGQVWTPGRMQGLQRYQALSPLINYQVTRTGSSVRELDICATISASHSAPWPSKTKLWQQSWVGVEIRNPTRWIILPQQPASRSSIWNIEKIFRKIFGKMQNCTGIIQISAIKAPLFSNYRLLEPQIVKQATLSHTQER